VVRDAGALPCCFVLSDQCFPPTMPAAGGFNCMTVLRIEDGRLDELVDIFSYYFRKCLKPGGGGLPHGSVILLGSLAQLADLGTELYAQELVRTLSDLGGKLGAWVSILPYIPVPIAGIQSVELVARLADLDSWLLTTTPQPNIALPDSRNNIWSISTRYLCWANYRSSQLAQSIWKCRTASAIAGEGPLPPVGLISCLNGSPPLTVAQEKLILGQLILDLNKYYCLNLDVNYNTMRGAGASSHGAEQGRVGLIGAFHAAKVSALAAARHKGFIPSSRAGLRISKSVMQPSRS
jgi:hypothetical protein